MPAMIPADFADTSWHNDACPSFTNEALGLTIWIDYAELAMREHPSGERFTLEPHDEIEPPAEHVNSDDFGDIIAAIDERRSEIALYLEQRRRAHIARPDAPFAEGDRLRLISMAADPDPIRPGSTGTVIAAPVFFQGAWSIPVKWDNGRGLSLVMPPDQAEKL
ncbi:hypothetical protein CP49_11745 [Bradyrhizobium valentinum]|uniref:DUF4314 domain-containing protein n=2 Tax=Bradyrhizobium valentinum TaxID=1518501 RepID=A0A0R3L2J2_9BRAD|nr:hypothetical protein CP49_11745 [Bradyrhizobium valentinum]